MVAPTVYGALQGITRSGAFLAPLLAPLLACCLIVAGALVRIRIRAGAVPVTGQTFAVCLSTWMLGRDASTKGAVLYVLAVLLGLPVLSGWTRGPHKMSFGYVLGFVACAWLSAPAAAIDDSAALVVFFGCVVGQTAAVLTGAAWTAAVGLDPGVAFSSGILPFLPGLLVKAVLVTFLVAHGPRLIGR